MSPRCCRGVFSWEGPHVDCVCPVSGARVAFGKDQTDLCSGCASACPLAGSAAGDGVAGAHTGGEAGLPLGSLWSPPWRGQGLRHGVGAAAPSAGLDQVPLPSRAGRAPKEGTAEGSEAHAITEDQCRPVQTSAVLPMLTSLAHFLPDLAPGDGVGSAGDLGVVAAGSEVVALSPEACLPLSQPSPGACLPCSYAGRQRAMGGAQARQLGEEPLLLGMLMRVVLVLLRTHATPL